jgi:hypothetical protein
MFDGRRGPAASAPGRKALTIYVKNSAQIVMELSPVRADRSASTSGSERCHGFFFEKT